MVEAEALSDLTAKRLAEQRGRDPSALLQDILRLSRTKEQLEQEEGVVRVKQPMGAVAVQ